LKLDEFLGYLELRSREIYWRGFRDEEGRCPICSVCRYIYPSTDFKINTIEANKYLHLNEKLRIEIVIAVDKENELTKKIAEAIKKKSTYQFAHIIRRKVHDFYGRRSSLFEGTGISLN
jgi:hypothetical protein